MKSMMLKVQIQTLGRALDIELKKHGDLYRLLVIGSRSAYTKDPGTVWHGESGNGELVEAIGRLALQCHHSPHSPTRITILDGMLVSLHYRHEETEFKLSLKEFEEGSNETLLLRSLLAYCKQLLHSDTFDRYVDSLEPYMR